jgi:hypothetical protein
MVKTKLVSLLLEENKKKVMGMIETERNSLGIYFSNKKKETVLGIACVPTAVQLQVLQS